LRHGGKQRLKEKRWIRRKILAEPFWQTSRRSVAEPAGTSQAALSRAGIKQTEQLSSASSMRRSQQSWSVSCATSGITARVHSQAVADEFLEHAAEEQGHADRIAERIVQLDGKPNFSPEGLLTRSHSEYVEGENLIDMIREDLVAERIAIESYSEIIRYLGDNDPTSRRLMEDILANEEEHAEDMSTLLERVSSEDAQRSPVSGREGRGGGYTRGGTLEGDAARHSLTGEMIMKPSTHDQTHGKYHEVNGDLKEKAGRATNNPNLEAEGTDEKVAGKVQKKIGQVEKVLED
jgi:bacterioferritin (cytochrome b1)/uncharacterized protein YjbJ (UPF0337 family)